MSSPSNAAIVAHRVAAPAGPAAGTRPPRSRQQEALEPEHARVVQRPPARRVLPGIAPPQKPTSTCALARRGRSLHAAARRRRTVGGMLFSGMSTIVVTPPARPPRVAVAKPSHSVRPGSLTCTWVSTSPGSSTSSSAELHDLSGRHGVGQRTDGAIRPSGHPDAQRALAVRQHRAAGPDHQVERHEPGPSGDVVDGPAAGTGCRARRRRLRSASVTSAVVERPAVQAAHQQRGHRPGGRRLVEDSRPTRRVEVARRAGRTRPACPSR